MGKQVTVSQQLRLNVGKIRTARERVDRHFEPSVFEGVSDAYRLVEPVELGFDVYKDDDRYHVRGELATTLELSCSRCLEPYRSAVRASFDLRYVPQAENVGEGEREVGADDLGTAYYEGETIDLEQLIREQLYLAIPMKPLCDEACRGLCPTCGKNLNLGPCGCTVEWTDPRLAGLKGLLTRDE